MLGAIVAFIVYIAESFTGSVLENSSITSTCESRVVGAVDNGELEPLLPETDSVLSEFTRFDPSDTIFQEFDPKKRCFRKHGLEEIPTVSVAVVYHLF